VKIININTTITPPSVPPTIQYRFTLSDPVARPASPAIRSTQGGRRSALASGDGGGSGSGSQDDEDETIASASCGPTGREDV
jgi:hypothetical protein